MQKMPKELWISNDGIYMYPTRLKDAGKGHGNEKYIRADVAEKLLEAVKVFHAIARNKGLGGVVWEKCIELSEEALKKAEER